MELSNKSQPFPTIGLCEKTETTCISQVFSKKKNCIQSTYGLLQGVDFNLQIFSLQIWSVLVSLESASLDQI